MIDRKRFEVLEGGKDGFRLPNGAIGMEEIDPFGPGGADPFRVEVKEPKLVRLKRGEARGLLEPADIDRASAAMGRFFISGAKVAFALFLLVFCFPVGALYLLYKVSQTKSA